MLNIKCFHCGKSFTLNTEVLAAWLDEHKVGESAEKNTHYTTPCPFCRRVIKVPLQQVQRSVPRHTSSGTVI